MYVGLEMALLRSIPINLAGLFVYENLHRNLYIKFKLD